MAFEFRPKSTDGFVVISRLDYATLEEDYSFMRALEAVGVDNWEGYETACRLYSGELKLEDI